MTFFRACLRFCLVLPAWLMLSVPVWAAHGYAIWGELKYPAGFTHFDYVNPQAPKGGELRLVSNLRTSTFDKYNPFTIKGNAPAYLSQLMFDSLLVGSLDETATGYGLLADLAGREAISVHLPEDRPGSLRALLHVFERHGISLSSIHSSRTPEGDVHFRIGFDADVDAAVLARAAEEIDASGLGRVLA